MTVGFTILSKRLFIINYVVKDKDYVKYNEPIFRVIFKIYFGSTKIKTNILHVDFERNVILIL